MVKTIDISRVTVRLITHLKRNSNVSNASGAEGSTYEESQRVAMGHRDMSNASGAEGSIILKSDSG